MKKVKLTQQARDQKAQRDRARITNYQNLTSSVLKAKHDKVYTNENLANTTKLLMLNPEFNAVWNYRRDIFSHLISVDPTTKAILLGEDLQMVKAMMREYPKCYWIWNHRRWCLEELAKDHEADWKYELGLVLKVLELDCRNFHGWHYRRYVVSSIERELSEQICEIDAQTSDLKLYLSEFVYATKKIENNISNFSAWHSRSKLIPKIFEKLKLYTEYDDLSEFSSTAELFQSPVKLLYYELDLVKTGMFMDASDTSVWLYMQWLLTDDLFVNELKVSSKEAYMQILEKQFANVRELNELEKEDSMKNEDNVGCLKMMIFIKALINSQKFELPILDEEIQQYLKTLVNLDPLRKGHYCDQLAGSSPLVC